MEIVISTKHFIVVYRFYLFPCATVVLKPISQLMFLIAVQYMIQKKPEKG